MRLFILILIFATFFHVNPQIQEQSCQQSYQKSFNKKKLWKFRVYFRDFFFINFAIFVEIEIFATFFVILLNLFFLNAPFLFQF